MSIFIDAAIFLAAATIVVPVFRRLGLGDVLGYLGAGVVIGPWGAGLVQHPDAILHFAEVGVVFLLFIIGLELQPSRLWAFRKLLFGLGALQVVITLVAIAVVARLLGQAWTSAIIIGCALSLSSTAFVLQLMAERKELLMPHGRAAFAILLFQDLAVIPMLALTSAFSNDAEMAIGPDEYLEFGRTLLVLVGYVVGGRYLLRPLFRFIANVEANEVFTAAALLLVLGSGLLLESLGLSMGLGAFLAGVLVADSEFRHQLEADIVPFKGLLLGLFFMAVGMSANLGLLIREPLVIVALTAGLVAGKWLILYPLGRLFGLTESCPRRMAFLLAQGGEFAFVILTAATAGRILESEVADLLVLVVTLSMITTPILVAIEASARKRGSADADQQPYDTIEANESHVVIAGFGRFGQIIARILTAQGIPYTALDSDPSQIDLVRRYGNKIYYGDAAQLHLLKSANVAKARLFVLAVGNVETSVRIAERVKQHYPGVRIYARARNRSHALALRELGCEVIMRDTFLSSLYVAERVLIGLGYDQADAENTVEMFREHDVEMLDQQFAIRNDEEALVQSSVEAANEFRFLLQSDTE
ncbi:MAG: monovalent cation:proton antiporter-2 (CPA2) family protein [Gammaproteobacteria bacterium]